MRLHFEPQLDQRSGVQYLGKDIVIQNLQAPLSLLNVTHLPSLMESWLMVKTRSIKIKKGGWGIG